MQRDRKFRKGVWVFLLSPPCVAALAIFYSLHVSLPSPKAPIQFYSTHHRDDLKLTLIQALKRAKHSIFLKTYALTDTSILSLLKKRAQEGVDIHLYYHKKTTPKLEGLSSPHLHFHPVQEKGLMHEKIWIVDESQIFLGSANITYSSLKMHENSVLGLYAPELARILVQSRPKELTYPLEGQTIQFFSLPNKRALEILIENLDKAQRRVDLFLFTFTHPDIVKKLVELHSRGVHINLLVDAHTARGASKKALTCLSKSGISIYLSRGSQLFHHKWALIDQSTLIFGSANWTQAAFTKNKDFLLLLSPLNNKQIKYINNIIKNANSHSEKFTFTY